MNWVGNNNKKNNSNEWANNVLDGELVFFGFGD